MRQRTRKLIGTFLLLALVIFWALFGMLVAQGRVAELSSLGRLVIFLVLGLAWVLPAGLLIRWMARRDS
jgi:Na+/H+-dicarboxylate symporter